MNKNSSPLILAIDSGTSSTRVLAFDFAGQVKGQIAQRAYAQTTTHDGGVETDADALLELTAQCLDEVLESITAPVAAVSMSCFWHSLLGVGEDDAPRTPLFSWADNRAAPYVGELRTRLDENASHARTGCVFHASYWLAKLLWLHATRPELFDGKTRWMSFGEYLSLKWLGVARVSLSMASGTGIFNQSTCDWDEETLSALPIGRTGLSPLCDASDALNAPRGSIASTWNTQNSNIGAAYASRWPQLRNAKWFPALGDGACSNLGSGCAQTRGSEKTRIALNIGTSGALRVVLNNFSGVPPRGLFHYRIDKARSVVGGALSNGGNVLMWARKNLVLSTDAEARIAAMSPDAHGLTVLPFLAGERSPSWNDAARFCISGATLDTAPEEIYRAALEGTSLRFLRVLQQLQNALQDQTIARAASPSLSQTAASTRDDEHFELIVSGGALSYSATWARIMTDCLGVPLTESRESQASARGAALMALESLGVIENAAVLPGERGAVSMPDLAHHALYVQALRRQDALCEKLFGSA